MENRSRRPHLAPRPASSSANVTSAVGMEETVGRLRARRNSFFTHTVIWVTCLICLTFLVGTLAQAWSNSQLMQQFHTEQQQLQQAQAQHNRLTQAAGHYSDPSVVESEARQQLNYARPGEQLVVVVGANNSQPKPHSASPHNSSSNYWQDWWNIFFGH